MTVFWRIILFIYNLLIIVIGVAIGAAAIGMSEPMDYLNIAFSTPENRIIAGAVAAVLLILGIFGIINSLKRKSRNSSVLIEDGFHGQVSISIPAIKAIIMKAVKQVEGVKDIRIYINSGSEGLMVDLHMMVNPDLPVTDLTHSIQSTVTDYLKNIGGLQVAGVKVLVDDFNAGNIK